MRSRLTKRANPSREAIRRGPIDPDGAYFSLPGFSTYYDEDSVGVDPDIHRYDLSAANLANIEDAPTTIAILQEALKDSRLTPEDQQRIRELLADAESGEPHVGYMDNDELPLPDAAKRLGYDGILVWENDDVADPSSVFLWNVSKAKPL